MWGDGVDVFAVELLEDGRLAGIVQAPGGHAGLRKAPGSGLVTSSQGPSLTTYKHVEYLPDLHDKCGNISSSDQMLLIHPTIYTVGQATLVAQW